MSHEASAPEKTPETRQVISLLQSIRDLTGHCLQLVLQEETDELGFWLIRRRACMDEIDRLQQQTDLTLARAGSEAAGCEIRDLLQAIEALDQELNRQTIDRRDQYHQILCQRHQQQKNWGAAAVANTCGQLLDRTD
jgi:hypothetical protein